jgi:N-acetylglucosaminyl-diphospho-decaprenol L-rhamnosyltransferase
VPESGGARVAIVIVTYRSYVELRRCLASIERHAPVRQCVVVDHESNASAVSAIARDYAWARVIAAASNEGFAAGVNRGAADTDAEYLLLLNPDCVMEPGFMPAAADWMDGHATVGIAGPIIRDPDGSVQASARRFPDLTTAIAGRSSWLTRVLPRNPLSRRNLPCALTPPREPRPIDWVSGACMLIRRRTFDAINGMDPGFFLYWEDADFCRRAAANGWQTVYLPIEGAMHTGAASSRHASDLALTAFHRSAYRLFTKHASGPLQLLRPLVWVALQLRLRMMRRVVRMRARREMAAQAG